MSYRREMLALVLDLEEQARQVDFANDPKASDKHRRWHRQAEVLRFILDHPDQMDLGGEHPEFEKPEGGA